MKSNPVVQSALLAVRLLTRMPTRRWLQTLPSQSTQGLAVAFYPLVGVLIGAVLWVLQTLLGPSPAELTAFIALVAWISITGALHLDGLADCADGYFAAHKHREPAARREQSLAVMREPAIGAMAVVALILVLLGKWVALVSLLDAQVMSGVVWLLVPALARTVLLPYMMSSPYARPGGMADVLQAHLPRRLLWGVTAVFTLALLILWPFWLAFLCLGCLALLMLAWRVLWSQVIGGYTGDCLGALVELAELMMLLLLVMVWVRA